MNPLKMFLFVVLIVTSINATAQYTTPGNSQIITLDFLVSNSGGVVAFSNGSYVINNTLTIAATDTLKITQAATIRVDAGKRIEVSGSIISNPATGKVHFTAIDTSSASTNFRGFRFENSHGNIFRNTIVSYGGGIQIISTTALFEYSVFRKNGSSNVSAAITYSSCSPIIRYCTFSENARSAIGSGANIVGSPKIMYNTFYRNTTDNSNRPQINIGPGSTDSLYIVGNYIEGFYTNAGGIGISNLLATGSTKAVIKDNFIINNRYGYAQIGNNISSIISNNTLKNNNIQNEPNLGGSGLNFQATGSGNTAVVRRNIISGNLWGVTIQNNAQPEFGTSADPGGNVFFENMNGGNTFALYNNTVHPISAIGNYWGTNQHTEAENYIFHQPDQASLGLVSYLPIQPLNPILSSFAFLKTENPQLTADVFGTIDQQTKLVTIMLPSGTSVTSLIPKLGLALGVSSNPATGVANNFSQDAIYNISTPHGETAMYTVRVTFESLSFSVTFNVKDLNGNPLSNAAINLQNHGTLNTNVLGTVVYSNVLSGTYSYQVSKINYQTLSGSVVVANANIVVDAVLQSITNIYEFELQHTKLSPNPAIDYFSLSGLPDGDCVVYIRDMQGKTVLQLPNPNNNQRIDISNLKKGVYFVSVHFRKAEKTQIFQKM